MDANEIMKTLDDASCVYQSEAVQAAMDRKNEVVPLLLEHLEQVLLDPEKYTDPEYESHLLLYSVYLLSHHRVREAHSLLVALMSLIGETPFNLLGDAVHEGLPKALWKTCGSDPADIIRLVENRAANEYCRSSAIKALTYGVAEKSLSREEVVEFLQGLFTGEESSPIKPMIWNSAASALGRLWPGESMDVLQKAFDDELIEPFFINMENIEFYLEEGKETRLATFELNALNDLDRTPHDDLHWWACFNPRRSQGPLFDEVRVKKQKRSAAKKKRKQVKAARKKARSRKKRKR